MCALEVRGADATDATGLLLQRVNRSCQLRNLVVQGLSGRDLGLASQHGPAKRSGGGGSLRKHARRRVSEGEKATHPHTHTGALSLPRPPPALTPTRIVGRATRAKCANRENIGVVLEEGGYGDLRTVQS